jgi:hypothetical protein
MSDIISTKIQDSLAKIDAHIEIGISLDEQYKQAKAILKKSLIQSVVDSASEMEEGELKDYISFLYWHNRENISSKILADIVGIHYLKLKTWINPATCLVRCRDCNQYFEHTLTSRADLDKCETTGESICEDCQDRRRQDNVSYEHYLASQRREIERLRSLPYSEYLKTEHWQEVRKAALKRARYRCQICNAADATLNVHHRTYEHRGEEYAADVVVLCENCHAVFHLNGKLSKE